MFADTEVAHVVQQLYDDRILPSRNVSLQQALDSLETIHALCEIEQSRRNPKSMDQREQVWCKGPAKLSSDVWPSTYSGGGSQALAQIQWYCISSSYF